VASKLLAAIEVAIGFMCSSIQVGAESSRKLSCEGT